MCVCMWYVCVCVCACGMCVNQVGGYSCQCHDGYTLYTDGFSCNETTGTTYIGVCMCVCACVCVCVCACGMCVNQVGGYSCQCHDRYTLYTDGFSCNETTGTTYIGVCMCVCACVCVCVHVVCV